MMFYCWKACLELQFPEQPGYRLLLAEIFLYLSLKVLFITSYTRTI